MTDWRDGCPEHGKANYQYPADWTAMEEVPCKCLICGYTWVEPNGRWIENHLRELRVEYYARFE